MIFICVSIDISQWKKICFYFICIMKKKDLLLHPDFINVFFIHLNLKFYED